MADSLILDRESRAENVHLLVRARINREKRLIAAEARVHWKIGHEFGRVLHGIGQYAKAMFTRTPSRAILSSSKRSAGIYRAVRRKSISTAI